jgi:multicomponent Na+:H+ antiporter subunit E
MRDVAFAVAVRGFGFFALWLMLAGVDAADLPAAVITVIASTWASIRLVPPGAWRLSVLGIARMAVRFPAQSVIAGVDVAWRAMRWDLKVRAGFVTFPSRLPPGTPRIAFGTLCSLLPGTLPCGPDENGAERVHCLDITQPVVAQLGAEEALFIRALGSAGRNG